MRRVIFVVLDGVGVGALPDAAEYGDSGSDTLGNVSRTVPLRLPSLQRLGLGNVAPIMGVPPVPRPLALAGRLAPRSVGKDTTVGHWEHMGLVTPVAFPTYPKGFPDEVIEAFAARIGRQVLGNRPASGTKIIAELGEQHLATGKPIVYTSADSVFQIAAHLDVVPLQELYAWCEAARDLLRGAHAVARVIARPFQGTVGAFARTEQRRDFSLPPTGPTYLDLLQEARVPVLALGKIGEVFGGHGITESLKTGSNSDNLALVGDLVKGRSARASFERGMLFTNLVDFDMVWGHRNDVEGFAAALEAADRGLKAVAAAMHPKDELIVTADHGVDPTTASTDHSREYVPVLLYPPPGDVPAAVYEGYFADTGATVYEYLTKREPPLQGQALGRLLPARGWHRSTPVQSGSTGTVAGLPGRVGALEAGEAARWLTENLGAAPEAVVVLGSGLELAAAGAPLAEVPYRDVPHWPLGSVPGHPHALRMMPWGLGSLAVLRGRVHEYEGFDLSETQLSLRSMAAWGVHRAVLVSAGGAVASGLVPGAVVVIERVADLQYPSADGEPAVLTATDTGLIAAISAKTGRAGPVSSGVHASVPGPQYETPAELDVLWAMGVATVSMSPAAELRAAHEEGLRAAVISVVANVGDTTHEQVLSGSGRASGALTEVIGAILTEWGAGR